jgi:RNA polymerase sigma-70 factor (ECF subfamily)
MSSRTQDFEALVRDHARIMSAAIRRVCGRRHGSLIPDVEQEVRLALWKRLQGGNEIRHPASYLYKVALTTALAVLRGQRNEQPLGEVEEQMQSRAADSSILDDGLLPAERSQLLHEALGQLDGDRERAMRAYLAGFNHREVARLFGWSESVARHRIYRSIDELKRKLRPDEATIDQSS